MKVRNSTANTKKHNSTSLPSNGCSIQLMARMNKPPEVKRFLVLYRKFFANHPFEFKNPVASNEWFSGSCLAYVSKVLKQSIFLFFFGDHTFPCVNICELQYFRVYTHFQILFRAQVPTGMWRRTHQTTLQWRLIKIQSV